MLYHLSLKIKITFVIISLFLSIRTHGQEKKDLGIGTFTFQWSHYPNRVFSDDSTRNILAKRVYYIRHTKVIMKTIGPSEELKKDTVQIISEENDLSVKSKVVAKAIYPTYLADYNSQKYFMYFENTKKLFYFQDSLKKHPEDLYNPKVNNPERPKIINISGSDITIAGKHCLAAFAIRGNDTTKFYYTKEKLKFVSPLNTIPGVENPILGIQTLQKDGNAFGLFIINIKDEELPDDIFTIPTTARFKTWDEIITLGKTPN
nr:hypothetical protein [Pedobacter kyonggii]